MGGCIIFSFSPSVLKNSKTIRIIAASILLGSIETTSSSELPVIEFAIKPNLCVLSESEKFCQDTLELKWRSETPRNVCLYQQSKRLPLRCWEKETSGQHYVSISTKKNLDFQLREIGEEELLARKAFQVVQDMGSDKKFRKRRRNAWNFF